MSIVYDARPTNAFVLPRMGENVSAVPRDVTNFHNPFELGRNLIWSGNVVVAVIAVGLLGRLQRQ